MTFKAGKGFNNNFFVYTINLPRLNSLTSKNIFLKYLPLYVIYGQSFSILVKISLGSLSSKINQFSVFCEHFEASWR